MSKIKSFRPVKYISQQQNWTGNNGSKLQFQNFVPALGTDGKRRNIIDGFWLNAYCVATFVTAPTLSADLWRIFDTVSVQQQNGVLRYNEVTGDALRVCNYKYLGAYHTREQYNVAAASGVSFTVSVYVPLAKPYEWNIYATSMPAEALQFVKVGQARSANFNLGSATVTITSIAYEVVANCHDEPAGGALDYAVDVVQVNDFPNNTANQLQINIAGRPRDVDMYSPGADGGQLFTPGVLQAQLIGIMPQSETIYPQLVEAYSHERGSEPGLYGTTNQSPIRIDPFIPDPADGSGSNAAINPRAVALQSINGGGADEGPVVQNLTLNLTLGGSPPAGAMRVITRALIPRDPQLTLQQMSKAGRGWKLGAVVSGGRKVAASDVPYFPQSFTGAP